MEETVGNSSTSRLQIYPSPSDAISPYLRDKYEKEARKNWDLFYKRNADRFFKDRHYLDKEWGHYIGGKVEEVLQTHDKTFAQNFTDLLHISTVIGGFS